jgi:hypothetical protein
VNPSAQKTTSYDPGRINAQEGRRKGSSVRPPTAIPRLVAIQAKLSIYLFRREVATPDEVVFAWAIGKVLLNVIASFRISPRATRTRIRPLSETEAFYERKPLAAKLQHRCSLSRVRGIHVQS